MTEPDPGLVPQEPLAAYTVTCKVAGCENADIPIAVLADEAYPRVICGPCSQPISEIRPGWEAQ